MASSMQYETEATGLVSSQMREYHGSLVLLRPIRFEDTDSIVRWRNEQSVKSNLLTQQDITAEGHRAYLLDKVASRQCDQFVIDVIDSDVSVGSAFLKDIDVQKGKGEFGIFIGKEGRGRGFAREATSLLLEHAFETLALEQVYLTVFADNAPGIKAYEKAGFAIVSDKTSEVCIDGKTRSLLYMALSRARFEQMRAPAES